MGGTISLMLVAGVLIIAASLARRLCGSLGIHPLVGYFLVGLALGMVDQSWDLMGWQMRQHLEFLGQVGVIILLFKVGLESNVKELLAQLKAAVLIWAGNVLVAAALGFATVYYLLELGLLPALFTAVALSATSAGVATAIWRDAGALNTREGAMVEDVAELDDISAIILMALLFTAAPLLVNGEHNGLGQLLGTSLLVMVVKLAVLVTGCYLFAQFLEQRFTHWFITDGVSAATVAVATAGAACVIAGLAEWLGFSIAIGALLAGLAFSRDPAEFQIDEQLTPIYELLSPFFFISLGFAIDLLTLGDALYLGAALLVVGIVGKLAGAGLPATALMGSRAGLLIGISMVPRAEIAMIIMLQGARMGPEFVPPALFSAMGIVVLVTALLVPLALVPLIESRHE